MKRDLPRQVEEQLDEDERRGLLASRAFWIGGALSLAVWVVLGLWLLR